MAKLCGVVGAPVVFMAPKSTLHGALMILGRRSLATTHFAISNKFSRIESKYYNLQ